MLVYERSKTLMEAELGDELVALEPEGGFCFGFNSVAKRVWELLDEPRSTQELTSELLKEFDVTPSECAAGLDELLIDLAKMNLVRRR